jgi:hypothetical protein
MESNASLEAEFASTSIKPENEGSFFLYRIEHCGALLRVILTHLGRKVSDQTRSSSRMSPSVIGGPVAALGDDAFEANAVQEGSLVKRNDRLRQYAVPLR